MGVTIRHEIVLPPVIERLAEAAIAWLSRQGQGDASEASDDNAWLARHGLGDLADAPEIAPPEHLQDRIEASLDALAALATTQRQGPEPIQAEPPRVPPSQVSDVGPEAPKPQVEVPLVQFSAERKAVIRREWPLGTPIENLDRMLSELPGLPIADRGRIAIMASKLGVHRPPLFSGVRVTPASKTPKIVSSKPEDFRAARGPAMPPPKSAAQLQREREAADVAEFIARKGVTRCPTAMVEPSSAIIPKAELLAIAAHDAEIEQRRRDEHMERTRRGRTAHPAKAVA